MIEKEHLQNQNDPPPFNWSTLNVSTANDLKLTFKLDVLMGVGQVQF